MYSTVILFNKEFSYEIKNGVIGILIPNKEGTQIFKKRYEVKHHDDEITKILMFEFDEQSHYFITGSLDKEIKLFNYEKNFGLIFTKELGDIINNLFFCRDYNNKLLFMASLFSGIIKVLDDKFNGIFNNRTFNIKNFIKFII